MIEQGTDGLSCAHFDTSVMGGGKMLDFIPLH